MPARSPLSCPLGYRRHVKSFEENKPIKVVIKGLPGCTKPQEITDLEDLGYTVTSCIQLISKRTKLELSFYLVTLPRNTQNITIFDLSHLGYMQVKVEGLIRLPNNSFWRDYDSDGGRNLKTQKGFIQWVRENIQYKVINNVPFELLSFANPLDYAILDIRLDLVLNVRKRDLSPTALHAIALGTINTRFPPEEWLHIYTDGSLLDFAQGAGIGVFSHLFSFYLHAGPLTTHFDGEVEAIHIALQQLAVRLPPIERAVILSDSTSALQALSNYNENNCLRVQNCRELLGKIKGKIVFQWVPYHSSRVACDKPWSTLCKKSHGIPSSSRAAAVAKFRLLTGHDCLSAHLFRFNLVTSPICVLCDTGQDMTAAHLDECSALNDLNCIVKRYWREPVA
ncbi:uncharacterized protein LOC103524116 [Trichonephila clavipes]|nr:uncharacterized protein LOC103524116 [Trichonephila clavipes]